MAKINHYSSIDVIQNMIGDAKNRGIVHLKIDEGNVDGRYIDIEKRKMLNFGTCGYMGLEKHPLVIDRAVEFTRKYGMQYSLSRVYASAEINEALEEKLSKIYEKPVIVYPSTSQGHISVIPIMVNATDAVILDQQVHISVQTGVQLLRQKGTFIDMIRHSHLEMLERKINELKDKFDHIWYMVDGVYSMYGDGAPMKELFILLEKYPQLHIYVDDAHGMSWEGKNGAGYVFNEVGLHDRMILVTTLAKGFGAIGGMVVFPNKDLHWKVRVWGGPLTYSHPLTPALIGAADALADIHLSDEIYSLQKEVQDNIAYCHKLLSDKQLPLMSEPRIPIKFIGAGDPKTGYALLEGVINDGFFVNLGMFPGVPIKNTGLRFTITRHVTHDDIKALANSIEKHYHRALEKEQKTDEKIRKAFKLPVLIKDEQRQTYKCDVYNTIQDILKTEWDSAFADKGNFDYEAMLYLEQVYTNNSKPEENSTFYYLIKKDNEGKIVAATFLTAGLQKDDFLAPEDISKQIEEKRKVDPYYLCSKSLAMGTMLTLGEHLYIDRSTPDWKNHLNDIISDIDLIRINEKANNVILRDFDPTDKEMNVYMINQGFVQIEMPNSNIVDLSKWDTIDEFYQNLSKRSKKHFKQDVEKYISHYSVEIKDILDEDELKHAYELFMNVSRRNFAINMFPYPYKAISAMNNSANWEFILLSLKDTPSEVVTYCMCYKTESTYMPIFMGIDYDCEKNPYRQGLFQILLRAKQLGLKYVDLGLSANIEKRKFGADQKKLCLYSQTFDNYNMEVIASMGH